jgi:hypothetical protein
MGLLQNSSLLFGMLAVASACTLAAIGLLGRNVDPAYYWALLLAAPLAVANAKAYQRVSHRRALRRLREGWGKELVRDRVFPMIEALHRFRQAFDREDESPIDDQTWRDLNMDEVYSLLDRTLTNPGECVLYEMLRTPLLGEDRLRQRGETIRLFQTDQAVREKIQLILQCLGRWNTNTITSLVWGQAAPSAPLRHLYSLLALLASVTAVGAPLLWGTHGFLAIAAVYAINLVASHRTRTHIAFAVAALRYQGSMIAAARRIADLDCPAIRRCRERLRETSLAVRDISRRTFLLFPESSLSSDIATLLYAHLDIYFLRTVRTYHAVMALMDRHRGELKSLYMTLGELDALQSIASYREGLPAYVEPAFTEQGDRLRIEEARHPLVANPIPNSIALGEGGVTITGSNMAGKTTFLRTLSVNVILAQTVHTCLASSYTAALFRVFSLINDADSLLEGKSYYLVQAEHLLTMIRSSERQGRTLCLIDEPLAGTNSPERSAASFEIIRYLTRHNATVVLATHDLELAGRLQDRLKNYYFAGRVTERGLEFDFRLKEGITPVRNAIDLLQYMGFPESIVKAARREVCAPGAIPYDRSVRREDEK